MQIFRQARSELFHLTRCRGVSHTQFDLGCCRFGSVFIHDFLGHEELIGLVDLRK